MKKFLKITGIAIVLILVLLVLVPVIFKDKIVEIAKTEINNQVNAKVNFGDFDLSIFRYFPNLNFEINDVSVVGINAFEQDTLVYLKQFSAKVDLMSVLGEQIQVLGIHLIEPQINARVLADSSANWDIAKASELTEDAVEAEAATEEVVNEESPAAETGAPFQLSLKEFSIQKANIVYQDDLSDMTADLKNLDYSISGDFSLSEVELKTALLIEAITVKMEGVKFLNKTNIEYTAALKANLDQMKFDILENNFRLNELALDLTGFVQMNEDESIDMDLSFGTNDNQFKDLLSLVPAVYTKDFNDIKTAGSLKLAGFAKGTYAEGQLPAFNLNLNIDNASVQYPDLPTAVTKIFVDLNVDNKDGIEDHTIIDLKRFDLNIGDNPFSARYITKTPISDPYIDGFVKGKLDFDKLKDALPLDSMSISGLMTLDLQMKGNLSTIEEERYDEFEAQGNIGLENFVYKADNLDYDVSISSTNFEVSPRYFDLKNFDAKVGKSDFHADGRIDNFIAYYFKNEVLTGTFNLNSSLIDGTELAGEDAEVTEPATESASTEVTTAPAETTTENTTATEAEEPMSVVEIPANIDFVMNTNINKILYDTYVIDNFAGKVMLKEGVATLAPVKMNMVDGSLEMAGTYDTRDVTAPKIDFDFKMKDFDIKKTFETFNTVQKMAPIAENCEGKISLFFDLKATLDEHMEPIQETMNGAGSMMSKRVKVGGSKAIEKMAGLLKSDKYKEAHLENIDGSFTIENGNIIISPIDIKMNSAKATFGGKQGVDQSIDYLLNINVPRKDLGGANQLIDGLLAQGGSLTSGVDLGETINVNVFVKGTLTDPKFSIGLEELAGSVKDQVKDKIKDVLNQGKAKAVAEAKKQAAALLAQAEKQSVKLNAEAEKQAKNIRLAGKKAAQQAKVEADKQIDKLVKDAGSNPIAKMAAKEAGKKLKKEAAKKAQKIEQEANKKADQLVSETKKQTTNLKSKAKSEGDKLIALAEKM